MVTSQKELLVSSRALLMRTLKMYQTISLKGLGLWGVEGKMLAKVTLEMSTVFKTKSNRNCKQAL